MVNFGQIICGLIAIDPIIAQNAIKLIYVQYEELKPIISIEACNHYNNMSIWSILSIFIIIEIKKFKNYFYPIFLR